MATYIDSILAVSGTFRNDAAYSATDNYAFPILTRRRDDLTSDIVDTNGDYSYLSVSRQGALHVSGIMYVPQGIGITSIAAGDNNIGNVDVVTLPSIPAGTNNIGDVDVLSLPSIPTGTNNIGDVDVLTVPADPFGLNADAASATGSISAKLRFIAATGIPVTSLPSIPAGTNNIGDVDVLSLPSIPTGTNSIGDIRSITTSITPGTATTNLGKVAGGSAGATDVGVALLAARRDTLSALTPTNGQYTWLSTNALGQLHISGQVGIVGSIPAGTQYTEGTGFGGNATGTAVLARMDQVLSNQVGAGYPDDDPITLRTGISGSLWVLDEYLSKSVHPVGARYPGYPSVYNERVMFMGGPDTSTGSTQQVHVLNNRLLVNVDGSVTTTTNVENALTSLGFAGAGSNIDTLGIDLQRILGISVVGTTFGSSLGLAVGGGISHDNPAANTEPLLIGGHASATSPTAVSTDNDAVRAWFLRNGAQVVSIGTSTGVVPADTTTGLRVSLNPSDTTNGAKVYLNSTGDAVLSDVIDNPTTSSVAAMGMVWGALGGTKWSRVLQANQTVLGTDGTGVPAAGLVGRALNGAASIYDDGEYGPVRITRDGKLLVSGTVAIIDGSGNQITSFGGGTQYTEGDTDATIVGTALLFESNTGTNSLSVVSNSAPLPISDAGGALTVDGTVTVTATDLDIRNLTATDVVTANLSATDNAVLDTIDAVLDAINAKLVTGTDIGDVTINNASGASAVNIQDGGNTITVDGTVTANLSATDNAVLDQIELNQDTQTTALQLIDNSIFVDDADWTEDTSSHTLVGAVTQVVTTVNTNGDTTPLTTNAFRELRVAIPESDLATAGTAHVKKYFTQGVANDGIVWSPAAGKRWYITDIFINVSAACTVTLEDDLAAGDSVVWKAELAANSGWSHSFHTPLFSGEDAADLLLTTSAGTTYVCITGYEV